MIREEAKELLPIIQAFVDGKKIQRQDAYGGWIDCFYPELDLAKYKYRIKSKPEYRPFKNQKECWNEMHNHPNFGWVKGKSVNQIRHIERIGDDICISWVDKTFLAAFNDFLFIDGTPFGIKEE